MLIRHHFHHALATYPPIKIGAGVIHPQVEGLRVSYPQKSLKIKCLFIFEIRNDILYIIYIFSIQISQPLFVFYQHSRLNAFMIHCSICISSRRPHLSCPFSHFILPHHFRNTCCLLGSSWPWLNFPLRFGL